MMLLIIFDKICLILMAKNKRDDFQLLRKEWKEKLDFSLDKKPIDERMGYLRQGEARKEYLFDTPQVIL